MKLHEYQAKQLFLRAGISVPRGIVANTPQAARAAYGSLTQQLAEGSVCNVKAQLHAGGRGQAGGIRCVRSVEEAAVAAAQLLGKPLVTRQTGPAGLPVSAVLVEEHIAVARECYLAVTIDRFHACPVVVASQRGGVDIEEVAATAPQEILQERFAVQERMPDRVPHRVVEALGLTGAAGAACRQLIPTLWSLFATHDASLIEINPLVVTADGRLCALDAKVTLDDNAAFRHPELASCRDESQEQPLELQAGRIGISYVGLDGTIGCLVNGAGLAMATNDIITLAGGRPANFLDVGGGANVEQVTKAFALLLADPRVKAILVNIFGGIMRCDWIAQGLLNATASGHVTLPIVVRLQGTYVQEGRRLLEAAKRLTIINAEGLAEAAQKVVALAQ